MMKGVKWINRVVKQHMQYINQSHGILNLEENALPCFLGPMDYVGLFRQCFFSF